MVLYCQLQCLPDETCTEDPWIRWQSLQYGFDVWDNIRPRQAEEGSASRLHHTAFSGQRRRQDSIGVYLMDAGSGIA